tara:strand:- start:1441 stop:2724 length:1284 start_codon:yes stop_codon:yes gene_type:complete
MSTNELYEKFLKSSGVVTDSRKINKNSLFFSLKGPNFNGNHFAKSALENGANFAVIDEKKYYDEKHNYILVNDCLQSLQNLANFHRKKLDTKIIAITGSNGKTTTKELIYSVLKTKFNCICTEGNLNNHIGVPLSLLKFSSDTEIGIIEMGANHLGEIKLLTKIAQPNYGYITNFGKAHLEGFGNEKGVIKGKSELYDFLKSSSGLIFFNSDDSTQKTILCDYHNKFGFGQKDADLKYSVISEDPIIKLKVKNTNIESSLFGNYNVQNIISAVSIGTYFGVDMQKIKSGISNYISSNNRSQIIEKNNNKIFLDAYNANPTSMLLAIKYFEKYNLKNKILIIGDMYELGKEENKFHQEIVDYCQSLKVEKVFLIGEIFSKTRFSKKFTSYLNYLELLQNREFMKIKNCNILIKGSRGIKLEKIVDFIS